MSPPIREGSGSSIGSIRLGDGTEIAEVRTGAGDVLFSAIPDSVVLQPESGDLSHFSGDTGSFSITSSGNFGDGDNILQRDQIQTVEIFSDSGLDAYPSVNQRLSGRVRGDSVGFNVFGFGAQDIDNRYEVAISTDNRIEIREDGSTLTQGTPTIDAGTVYQLHWIWKDTSPNIGLELYNNSDVIEDTDPITSITADTTTYTSGGITIGGFQHSDGDSTSSWADYFIRERL